MFHYKPGDPNHYNHRISIINQPLWTIFHYKPLKTNPFGYGHDHGNPQMMDNSVDGRRATRSVPSSSSRIWMSMSVVSTLVLKPEGRSTQKGNPWVFTIKIDTGCPVKFPIIQFDRWDEHIDNLYHVLRFYRYRCSYLNHTIINKLIYPQQC